MYRIRCPRRVRRVPFRTDFVALSSPFTHGNSKELALLRDISNKKPCCFTPWIFQHDTFVIVQFYWPPLPRSVMFVERESHAPKIVQAPELIMSQNYSYHAVRNLRIYGTEKWPFFTVEPKPHCC